ncbi:MAG: phage tail protein [Pseudomonas sp.]|nr:phage tail protein [Pseudomonas sp.]
MSSTGQALGYVVGAVAGYFTGGASYVLMGAAIGGAVGAALDPPKGPNLQGPRLSDLSQQGASYGTPIPRVYGSVATHGNIFWIENNSLKETSRTSSSGGKGGGGGSSTTTYQYSATFALGLCEGPISGVRRIWINGDLIYDPGSDDMETILASNAAAAGFTIYTGTESQLPDPRMQAALGVANTPAYRGLAYIVFHDLALEKYGNTLAGAQVKVEVLGMSSQAAPTLQAAVPYLGTIVYAGDGYFQTATVNAGRFDLPLGLYYGSCTFRDYRYDGTLIATRTLEHPVQKSIDNDSLVYHKTYFVAGKPNCFFAACLDKFRISVYPASETLTLNSDAMSSLTQSSPYSYAAGYYWLASANYGTRITEDLGSFSTYSIAGANHPSLAVREDPATGRLFVRYTLAADGSNVFAEFDVLPSAPLWTYTLGTGNDYGVPGNNRFSVFENRLLVCNVKNVAGSPFGKLVLYDIGSNNLTLHGELPNTGFYLSADSLDNGFAFSGGNLYRLTDRVTQGMATLDQIVQAECLKSNLLTAGDVDVSSLTDTVHGYRITRVAALRSGIEPLQAGFPFDAVQSGYRVKFVRRGNLSSIATISADELGARADQKPGNRITTVREMDSQLPVRVTISFIDIAREYDVGEQYAERLNTDSVNVQTVELPVVLTATQALQKAETLLYMYWMERYEFSFALPPSFRHLEPSDVVTVSTGSETFSLRLTRIQYQVDGSMDCTARLNDPSTYVSTAIGADGVVSSGTIRQPGRTLYELLDIPAMGDGVDAYRFPVALGGYSATWASGSLYRSMDGGANWRAVNDFQYPSIFGHVLNVIGAPADSRVFDKSNALQCFIYGGQQLNSVSERSLLGGANHFAYGDDGRWEIIAAQNAVLQGDGTYVLTDLLRGRFGTEWAAASHTINDRVVLLDLATLQWCESSAGAVGLPVDYRGITSGRALDSDFSRSFTYRAVNLKCLSPVWLNGNRHPTTNDWTLTWVRRTRQGGEWRDGIDAPLGEASEAYEVEIYTSAAYATLKRTLTGLTTASATYTSAQQVTDFGSNQATLYVKVYQLSANVGRGYPLTTSITR